MVNWLWLIYYVNKNMKLYIMFSIIKPWKYWNKYIMGYRYELIFEK